MIERSLLPALAAAVTDPAQLARERQVCALRWTDEIRRSHRRRRAGAQRTRPARPSGGPAHSVPLSMDVLRGGKLVSKLNLYPARALLPRARLRAGAQQSRDRHGRRSQPADAPPPTQPVARTGGPLSAGFERHHPMMLRLLRRSATCRCGRNRAPRSAGRTWASNMTRWPHAVNRTDEAFDGTAVDDGHVSVLAIS
jgi:hypothetical protein